MFKYQQDMFNNMESYVKVNSCWFGSPDKVRMQLKMAVSYNSLSYDFALNFFFTFCIMIALMKFWDAGTVGVGWLCMAICISLVNLWAIMREKIFNCCVLKLRASVRFVEKRELWVSQDCFSLSLFRVGSMLNRPYG